MNSLSYVFPLSEPTQTVWKSRLDALRSTEMCSVVSRKQEAVGRERSVLLNFRRYVWYWTASTQISLLSDIPPCIQNIHDPVSCVLIATYILLFATVILTAAFSVTMSAKPEVSRSLTAAFRERLPFPPLRGLCLRNISAHYKDPEIRRKPWTRHRDLGLGPGMEVVNSDSKGFLVGQKMERHRLIVITGWQDSVFPQCWGKNTSKEKLRPQYGDLTKVPNMRIFTTVPGTLERRREELNYTMSRRRGADWETIKDPTPRREVEVDRRANPNQNMAETIKRELELAEKHRKVQREKRRRLKRAQAVTLMMDFDGNGQ
jgi:hypothetical protein